MKYIFYAILVSIFLSCARFEESSLNVSSLSGLLLTKLISDSIEVPLAGSVTGLTSGTLFLYINGTEVDITYPEETFTHWINKDTTYTITATTSLESLTCTVDNPNGNSGRYGNSSIQVTCQEVVVSLD